ncbi:MAG: hypothetical protein WD512_03175, partial [Candidatus Paceibacterota bacterium]
MNSQTSITGCSLVDFGTNQNNSLVFYYRLSRPTNLPSGTGTLRVMLRSNPAFSAYSVGTPQTIQNTSWSGQFYDHTIPCDISANQIQETGSTIYIEFETSSGIKTKSCEYPLKKTPIPTFSLSPTSLSIACGDTSASTFSVTPANIPAGATLTYQWSHFGGWSGSSTTSSITLTPTSGFSLPGTVIVTPVLNGVLQNQLSCTISRAGFTSGASVSGPTGICTGSSNYTLADLPSGQNVAWSLSNPALASLSNQTNAGTTVNFTGIGAQTLSATITNACGQNSVVSFVINTTSSTFSSPATISGNQNVCFGSANYTISNVQAGHTVTWSLSNPGAASLSNQTNSGVTVTSNVSGPQILTATITNTCNQTSDKTRTLYIGKPGSLNPKSRISGPTTVATGALATYSINSALPEGATSFEWWLPYPYETVSNFNYFGQ